MKTIQLKGKYAIGDNSVAKVDDEWFEYLNQWSWSIHGSIKRNTFYACRSTTINGKKKMIFMHRVILKLEDSGLLGDHKDRNGLNNQLSNLRIATASQNATNRTSSFSGTSKYLGVSWDKKKGGWRACITFKGKTYKISRHRGINGEEDAARAYDKKAKEFHGEFANLNFKE